MPTLFAINIAVRVHHKLGIAEYEHGFFKTKPMLPLVRNVLLVVPFEPNRHETIIKLRWR